MLKKSHYETMARQIRYLRPIRVSVINVKTLSFDNDWIHCLKKKTKQNKTKNSTYTHGFDSIGHLLTEFLNGIY